MRCLSLLLALLSVLSSSPHFMASAASVARHSDADLKRFYSRTHSLGDNYNFNPREWQTVNVTDLDYKYSGSRNRKRASSSNSAEGGSVSHLIDDVWNGLKGIGSTSNVVITWFGYGFSALLFS